MNERLLDVSRERLPERFALLIDATQPLGEVQFLPFTVPQPENPRSIWYLAGGVTLFSGLFFVTLLVQNDKLTGLPALVAAALLLVGLGAIGFAKFALTDPPPAIDVSAVERRGVFFSSDALATWNGVCAFYIPRSEISYARTEQPVPGQYGSTAFCYYFTDGPRWEFPKSAFRRPSDAQRLIEWLKTGRLPPCPAEHDAS